MSRRLVLLAHDQFSQFGSKTANCIIRYVPEEVVAVLDRKRPAATAEQVLGFGGAIPVVSTVAEALALSPTELVIGIAPPGGGLPADWRSDIVTAIGAGLDITSGLHILLSDDAEIASLASRRGVRIRDLRRSPAELSLPSGRLRNPPFAILLTVGTDCNVGKMSAAFELSRAGREGGYAAAVAPTGQTGIFLAGRGIAVDRVISDFVAGAAEELVLETHEKTGARYVVVEGQGSLSHPAYSGVTLSLLHGSMPHALLLCHHLGRRDHSHYPGYPLPPVEETVAAYERMAALVRPARVVAVAANGAGIDIASFRAMAAELEARLGVPVADPYSDVGGGIVRLVDAVFPALDGACASAMTGSYA